MNSCTIYNKAFTQKCSLRRHMVDVHKDVSIVHKDVSIVHKDVNTELMAASGSEQQREK